MIGTTLAAPQLKKALAEHDLIRHHSHGKALLDIICGDTHLSSAGFPYISNESFELFTGKIPHLFREGQAILDWADAAETALSSIYDVESEEKKSVKRGIKVVRTMVFTAAVTAPSDLWLLRQVLSTHKELGILDDFFSGFEIQPDQYAAQKKFNARQLAIDLHFLHARGYLQKRDEYFLVNQDDTIAATLQAVTVIDKVYRGDLLPKIIRWLSTGLQDEQFEALSKEWLRIEEKPFQSYNWVANWIQIEIGYRLLPLVLSLRVLERTTVLETGVRLANNVNGSFPEFERVFELAGLTQNGVVTQLGKRVFQRGPGPFGIIYAYRPYLGKHNALLADTGAKVWVNRSKNVSASQDANRKTFAAANNALDRFCEKYHFRYTVFIEHAVGQGEATRQRFQRSGEETIHYFGADLEDAAIEQALIQQKVGRLPQNMQFIRSADIGEPQKVLDLLEKENLSQEPAVMVVGNGFHEIRNQTNEKMINVFREYQQAGILVIFTEETALHDEDLLRTAWNTYHAGFRYVHEMSGQGLRPAYSSDDENVRWSWRKCAVKAGYVILDDYSYRTRKIYPYTPPDRQNPSISITYFCVPEKLVKMLGIKD